VTAVLRLFRHPVRTGRPGRPRLVLETGLLVGQMVKRYAKWRVVRVERRLVRGTQKGIAAVLAATHTGRGINTAYIERLNATFRASLAPLVRRGRAIAHTAARLTARMWLVGCAYNFCWLHESLRVRAPAGACGKWQERTPAIAAGLRIIGGRCWSCCATKYHSRPGSRPSVGDVHPSEHFNHLWPWKRDHR
jgi:hypothetical protein